MGLSKRTYEYFDKAKKIIPSLELRFIDNKCFLTINGVEQCWVQGDDKYMSIYMGNIFLGIILAKKELSLKTKLGKL